MSSPTSLVPANELGNDRIRSLSMTHNVEMPVFTDFPFFAILALRTYIPTMSTSSAISCKVRAHECGKMSTSNMEA